MTSSIQRSFLGSTALSGSFALSLGLSLGLGLAFNGLISTSAMAQCNTAGGITTCDGVHTTGITTGAGGNESISINAGAVVTNTTPGQVVLLQGPGNFLGSSGLVDGGITGHGIVSTGNATINIDDTATVSTSGDNLSAIVMGNSGFFAGSGALQTSGANASALVIGDGNTAIFTATSSIATTGDGAFGATIGSNNTVTIRNILSTLGAGATGIVVNGTNNTVGFDTTGAATIALGDGVSVAVGGNLIDITGTLSAQRGLVMTNASGTTSVTVGGSLTGTGGVAIEGGAGIETVSIQGTVTGAINLAGGADYLRLLGGSTVPGTLDGGGGSDTLALGVGAASTLNLSNLTGFELLQANTATLWTLTGAGTFNQVDISGGEVRVNGTLSGAGGANFTVYADGIVSGTGTLGSAGKSIFVSGTIAPGSGGVGTLTVAGNLFLNTASHLAFDLAAPNMVGGVNDLLVSTGGLQLDGVLDVNGLPGYGAGSYRLIDYVGVLNDNGLLLGTLPAFAGTATIQTSIAGQVNLILTATSNIQFWDGAGAANDGVLAGGAGTWNAATMNWTSPDGIVNAAWGSGFAVFGTPGGTVTLGSNIAYDGIQFTANGYTIAGNGFQLTPNGMAAVRVDAGRVATIAASITGGGGLSKADTGTLILTGANSYTGGTTVAGGLLQGNTTSLQGDITNNASLAFVQTVNGVYSGIVSGSGLLTKTGVGVLTLTAANTYSGGTQVLAGVLQGNATSLRGAILNNSQVDFNQAAAGTFTGSISGTGEVQKTGAGVLTLNGANTYTGGTQVVAGGLLGDATSIQGAITNNGIVTFTPPSEQTYAGIMSGSGTLRLTGVAMLRLTGANTYTGGTQIVSAELRGSTTSLQGNVSNNGLLSFEQAGDGVFAGAITGTGGLFKTGAGTVILTGTNTYTGGTDLAAGSLTGTTTSLQGAITMSGGSLRFDQAGNGSFAGTLNGTGAMVKAGAGTVTLTAANSFTGQTSIQAGTLSVTGTLGGAITVVGGGTLAGTGSVGSVTVQGLLTPGAGGAGTLTMASLNLGSGSKMIFDLATPGVVGGVNDLLIVNGALNLDGTLDVNGLPGYGAGSYRLINYTGSLTDNGLLAGTLPAFNGTAAIQTSVAGQVNLILTAAAASPIQFWDGAGAANDGALGGGNGTWNASSSNWTSADGLTNAAWANQFAVFGTPGGTVTLGSDIAFEGMQFTANGYTIAGGGLQLTPAGIAVLRVDAGITATIAAPITGSGGLTKTDAGTLILTGANTYTGGTDLAAGSLTGTTTSLQGAITMSGGSLRFDQAGNGSFAGTLNGTGAMVKAGAGTVTLTAANSFTGQTSIQAGTLSVTGTLGGAITVVGGGTLAGTGSVGSVTVQGLLTPGAGGAGTLTMASLNLGSGSKMIFDLATPGVVGGVNDLLIVNGALNLDGTLDVNGLPGYGAGSYRLINYTGSLTDNGLLAGTLPAFNGTAAIQTSVAGQVNLILTAAAASPIQFWDGAGAANDGALGGGNGTWNASSSNWTSADGLTNAAWANQFAVFGTPGGTVTLGSDIVFEGMQFTANGYTIAGGGSQLTPAGIAVLRVDAGITATIAAPITGSGGLTKTDAGTLILTGANTYTGATLLNAGVMVVNGSIANSIVTVNGGLFGGNGTIGGLVANGGIVAPGNSIGTITVNGNLALAGSTYEVETDASGASDRIVVTGTANLTGGHLRLVPLSGTYALGTSYNILTAAGGVTGAFADVNIAGLGAFITPNVTYGAGGVIVEMDLNDAALLAAAQTPNQSALAGALANLPNGNTVLAAVAGLTPALAPAAFDALSGEIHASKAQAASRNAGLLRDAMVERMSILDDTPGEGWTGWGHAASQLSKARGDANAASTRDRATGFFAGADRKTDGLQFGIALGLSAVDMTVPARASSANISAQHLGGYAGFGLGEVRIKAGIAGSIWTMGTHRDLGIGAVAQTLDSHVSGSSVGGFVEVSAYREIASIEIQPFVGGDWQSLHNGAMRETGGSGALTGKAATADTQYVSAGVRLKRVFSQNAGWDFGLYGGASWRHRIGDTDPAASLAFVAAPASFFTVAGASTGADTGVFEAGVSFDFGRTAQLRVGGLSEIVPGGSRQSVKVELQRRF